MLYALTSAYSRKDYDSHEQGRPVETNIGKLFSIFAWGLDIVQENAEMVKQWDDLEQARGAVLDRYGANWGVQRFSENDSMYRLAIRVKILSQLSGGDTDTIIKAAADLLGIKNHDVDFEDVFPAKIALYVDWLLLTQERQDLIEPIAWAIKRIAASGIGVRLYVRTYHTFRSAIDVKHGGAVPGLYPLDDDAAGGPAVRPPGHRQRADALAATAVAPGTPGRAGHYRRGAGGGAGAQCVAGPWHLGLLRPALQLFGANLYPVLGSLVPADCPGDCGF